MVVGYQQYDLEGGYNFFTPIFENTTGTDRKLDIQKMVLLNVEDEAAYIQVVGTNGKFGDQYAWFNAGDGIEAGWYNKNKDFEYVSRGVERGEAFYLYAPSGAKFQVAGSVNLATPTKPLDEGYNMIGNSTPYAVNIQRFVLVGADDEAAYIQVVGSDGKFGDQYAWFNTGDGIEAGWYNKNNDFEYVNKEYIPGEAFYIYVQSNVSYTISNQ